MGKAMFGVDLKPSDAAVAPNMTLVMQKPTNNKSKTGFKLSIDKKGKDQGKADLANAIVGYGVVGSSSYKYVADAIKQNIPANGKIKLNSGVIAFVTVNGNNKASEEAVEKTYLKAKSIIDKGGTVIMDSTEDANRTYNKSGEALVQEKLGEPTGQTSKGYNYWGKNPEIEQLETETIQEKTLTLMDTIAYPISEINSNLLKNIGYTPVQIKTLMNSLYSQIKTNSGKSLKEINLSAEDWDNLSIEEKTNIKKCN
jgi:hypothetical protein